MDSIKISGRVTKIFPTQQVSDKFAVQKFWVAETEGEYKQTYEIQSMGKTLGVLDKFSVNDIVDVNVNLQGRQSGEKVFNTLSLWKIEKKGQAAKVAPQHAGYSDDMPF